MADKGDSGSLDGEGRGVHEAELEQALTAGELVVVCWEPGCSMHRLPHWDKWQWVSRQRQPGYESYSHGICRWHYQAYRAEIDRYIAMERAAAASNVLTAT